MRKRKLSASLLAFGLLACVWSPLLAEDSLEGVPEKQTTLVGEVVTSGEFVEAAHAIEAAAKEGSAKLAKHFDFDALGEIALRGLEFDPDFRARLMAGVTGESSRYAITDQIAGAVKRGGICKLLRVHRHGGDYAAVFRIIDRGRVNYHDLKLVKEADGNIKIHDSYVLGRGELMSATMRQMLLPSAAKRNGSLLTQMESDFVTHYPKFEALLKAKEGNDYAKFNEVHASMPKSVQETKSVLILRYKTAEQLGKWNDVTVAITDFHRVYPHDGAIDVISLDALILEGKFDEALASIDRIDRLVGRDRFLDKARTDIKALKK
jgi:hypothetical protein